MRKIYITFLLALLPGTANAQYLDALERELTDRTRNPDNSQLPNQLYQALATYLNDWIFPFLIRAAVAVTILFIMYGAFQYFTAYGDENKATSAKKTITYAFVGLVIAFMAMGIAGLVQQSITNNLILQAQVAPVR